MTADSAEYGAQMNEYCTENCRTRHFLSWNVPRGVRDKLRAIMGLLAQINSVFSPVSLLLFGDEVLSSGLSPDDTTKTSSLSYVNSDGYGASRANNKGRVSWMIVEIDNLFIAGTTHTVEFVFKMF